MSLKINFSKAELDDFIHNMELEFDVVRLIDPVFMKVVYPEDSGNEYCHSVWSRYDRCENCSSLRALSNKDQAYKIEIIDDKTYWVISRYIEVDNKPHILELVKNVSDNFIMHSDQMDEMAKLLKQYNNQLITDPLTEVYNRRFLDSHFLPYFENNRDSTNLALIDVDNFKKINDTYGHIAGDVVLRKIGKYLKSHYNDRNEAKQRLIVRYGGDEFIVIATSITKEEFRAELDSIYKQMNKNYKSGELDFNFSFTYGIASSQDEDIKSDFNKLFNTAEKDMYSQKRIKKLEKTE